MDDSPSRNDSFEASWGAIGRSVGVCAAAVIALLGLLHHVPVWLACLRGAGALVLVMVLMRVAGMVAAALPRSTPTPQRDSRHEKT